MSAGHAPRERPLSSGVTRPDRATTRLLSGAIPTRIVDALAGKAVIRFDGNVNMTLPDTDRLGLLESDYEVLIVARSSFGGLQFLLDSSETSSQQHSLFINGTAGAGFVPNLTADPTEDDRAELGVIGQYSDGLPHLFDIRVEQDRGYLQVDGLQSADIVLQAMSTQETGLLLGSGANLAAGFRGDMAEVLIYAPGLDGDQRAEVQQYLADRWDVALVPEPSSRLLLGLVALLLLTAGRSRITSASVWERCEI